MPCTSTASTSNLKPSGNTSGRYRRGTGVTRTFRRCHAWRRGRGDVRSPTTFRRSDRDHGAVGGRFEIGVAEVREHLVTHVGDHDPLAPQLGPLLDECHVVEVTRGFAVILAGWSIPGELRLFPNSERGEAEAWASEGLDAP